MAENIRSVSIGVMIASNSAEDILVAYGLGSCVAVCLYDPVVQVGGMVHSLLPSAPNLNGANSNPAKFVDQGVPLLIEKVLGLGAQHTRLIVRLLGGAQMLNAPGFSDTLNIGKRNVAAAKAALQLARLRIHTQDTGGSSGRTVKLQIAAGRVTVKTLGKGEIVLD